MGSVVGVTIAEQTKSFSKKGSRLYAVLGFLPVYFTLFLFL